MRVVLYLLDMATNKHALLYLLHMVANKRALLSLGFYH